MASKVAARIIRSHPRPRSKDPPIQDDRGVIIFVSSISYVEGQMGMAAYASSKVCWPLIPVAAILTDSAALFFQAGVVGLVLPLAREFARYGIRVQAIAPTVFLTPMGDAIADPT